MTDVELLKKKMKESGMTITSIAEKAGILRETLYNRMNSDGDFKASEITSLTKVLRLNKCERDKIFFAIASELHSTRKEETN